MAIGLSSVFDKNTERRVLSVNLTQESYKYLLDKVLELEISNTLFIDRVCGNESCIKQGIDNLKGINVVRYSRSRYRGKNVNKSHKTFKITLKSYNLLEEAARVNKESISDLVESILSSVSIDNIENEIKGLVNDVLERRRQQSRRRHRERREIAIANKN